MLKLHKWKLLCLALVANLALIGSLVSGDPKSFTEWNWLDILGEGGLAFMSLTWLILILHSRPTGRVTQLLSLGLSAIFIAGFQDWLDEFIHFPENTLWDHWLESGFMPLGLILLTWGIFHWHKEQLLLNEQLRKRERLFREHRALDFTTSLNDASYLRAQLVQSLAEQRAAETSLALVLIDVDNFSNTNRVYGHQQGNHLLQSLSELILLNIRRNDLLCRYAGDRFALVLPNTGRSLAERMASEISGAVETFAYKPLNQDDSLFHTVSIGIALANKDQQSPDELIQQATHALLREKEKRRLALSQAA
jgi:diguanylate cyclase (GGDEF)-like protein